MKFLKDDIGQEFTAVCFTMISWKSEQKKMLRSWGSWTLFLCIKRHPQGSPQNGRKHAEIANPQEISSKHTQKTHKTQQQKSKNPHSKMSKGLQQVSYKNT